MRLLSALIPLADSRYRPFQIFDGDAIGSVQALRKVFDERFASPRESHPDRFSWDPWHVTRRAEDAPQGTERPPRRRLHDAQEQGVVQQPEVREQRRVRLQPVSYTHLTLPTKA